MGGRGLQWALTLVTSFLICFFLLNALPGDPADGLDSPDIPAAQAARTRASLGLDRPLGERLLATTAAYLKADFGVSTSRKRPVARVLLETLPYSLALGAAALLLAYGIGVLVALLVTALRSPWRERWGDLLIGGALVPRFWFSLILVLVFHGALGWLPASHAAPPEGGDLMDRLRYLILPAMALGLPASCVVARLHVAAMERGRRDLHITARRAAGLGGWALLFRHRFRPIAGLTATLFALDLPVIVSGAVVVEWVFSWPGAGRMVTGALLSADYPLALAATTMTAAAVLVGRRLGSVVARTLDPRTTIEGAR